MFVPDELLLATITGEGAGGAVGAEVLPKVFLEDGREIFCDLEIGPRKVSKDANVISSCCPIRLKISE